MRRLPICMLLAIPSVTAQDDFDRVLQLTRTRQKMAQALTHLPDYTCVATVDRSVQDPRKTNSRKVDTLRFEITYADDTELWSWPGAAKFEDKPVGAMIQSGAISQGEFSQHARAIFINGSANVKFGGVEDLAGRHTLRWDFDEPMLASEWTINSNGRSVTMASRGSFWADAATLEVIRLEVRSEGLPLDFPVASVIDTIDYAQVRIGSLSVLLPQTARLYLKHRAGDSRLNVTEFSHCRQYSGVSAIRYDTEPSAPPGHLSPAGTTTEISLPTGLRVPISLNKQIDSAKSVVGDLVEGIIDADLHDRKVLLIPKGSLITGRLRRMEKYSNAVPYFLVGIEFDDIEFASHHARFFGTFKSMESEVPGFSLFLSFSTSSKAGIGAGTLNHSSRETEHLPDIPGVGTFYMQGSTFHLPQGMRMIWQTQ